MSSPASVKLAGSLVSLGEVLDPTPTVWTHGSVGEAKAAVGGWQSPRDLGLHSRPWG